MEAHCFPHKVPIVVSCSRSAYNSKSLRAPLILLLYFYVLSAVETQIWHFFEE